MHTDTEETDINKNMMVTNLEDENCWGIIVSYVCKH